MSAYFRAVWRRPALTVAIGILACGLSVASWARADAQDGKGSEKDGEGRTEAEAWPAPGRESSSNSDGETVLAIDKSCWIVFQDKSDNYWFGSDGQGVCRHDGKTITRFTTRHGLCNDHIRGIQQHIPSGDILISTLEGVSKFDGRRFVTLPVIVMDSPDPLVEKGWVLNADDVWLPFQPGQKGPYRYDGMALYHLKFPKSPREDEYRAANPNLPWSPYEVYCVYKDRRGHMWFGTGNLGICRFDGKTRDWMYEAQLTELPNNAMFGIRSIIEDKNGAFWFCNTQYRFRITASDVAGQGRGQIAYKAEKGIDLANVPGADNSIFFQSIVEDNRGDLWMATYGDGVWRYDGNVATRYPVRDGDEDITIFSIYKDNHGDLWLGTHEAGAYKFNGKTFEKFEPSKPQR